jgi:Zn-dependent metalloprotease
MKKIALATLLTALTTSSTFSQEQVSTSDLSPQIYNLIKDIRTDGNHEVPAYIKFKKNKEIPLSGITDWIGHNLVKDSRFGLSLINEMVDNMGQTHIRYQQTFNQIPIEGASYIVHAFNDHVFAMNGEIFAKDHFKGAQTISETQALEEAKLSFKCESFKWEIESEEAHLKQETGDINATYLPTAELVYVAVEGDFDSKKFKLAYKFDIYAHRPIQRAWTFIDASNGAVLFKNKRLYDADTPGTATTAYSGTRNIISDSFGGGFRLREASRGNGINTYDMQNGTDHSQAIDVTGTNPNWVMTAPEQYALDAHWGAEMTYDYFDQEHGRNSINDNGFALNSYVHYDNNYANAFWDGQRMTYGDGSGGITALTSLDIAGHEISHGLTTFTADLVYQDESGALNESFSDIFGAAIEFYALGQANGDWTIGEDIGSLIRSMSNPGQLGDPDTYFGNNWAPLGGADNGGVHTNSGVQNFWFYLLTEGGSGTNDAGDAYTVNGIGLEKAAQIAFRNLTVYLGQNSNYLDARLYAIQSATDLFGPCSPEVIETTNAWYAVNVGDEYDPNFETDFTPSVTGGCQSPFVVDFSSISASSGTGTYTWDFGDGNTGSGTNPTHTYTTNGTYTVTLIEDGGPCGIDTAIYVDLITAGELNPPLVTDGSLCVPGTVDLFANAAGQITWWDAPTGGNQINAGTSYSPTVAATTSYWVESATGLAPDYVGPVDNNIGNGGYFTGNQSLEFDALQPFTLVSVWVDANGAGNRTIELRDNGGALIQSTVVNIPNGGSTITLNFNVPAGTGYELTSPSPDLYRNSDGANYPYSVANVCNITGSTAGDPGYYYYFYNWEIQTTPCQSGRVEVIAAVADDPLGTNDSLCTPGNANLVAAGSGVGTLNWYDDPSGTNQVGTGANFMTPSISTSTTFYVSEELPGALNTLGPVDNTFGNGGYFNGDQHLIFDVAAPVTLESVLVFAGSNGNRTIELRDNSGTVLQDTIMSINAGTQRIYLNFDLTPGTNYQLGVANGSNPDLFRNSDGPSYPYDLPGQVTITNSSAGTPGYYYFFYDWEIREASCITNLVPVDAIVNTQQDATIDPTGGFCPSDSPVNFSAADAGGTWSGTGITDGNAGTFDPAIAGAGSHTVIYTLGGICDDADTVIVSVNTTLDATITNAANYCSQDNAVTLTGANAGGAWSATCGTCINSSTGEFDPITAGVGPHSVTYTISGSCGDTDVQTVNVNLQQDATINAAGPFCNNDGIINLTSLEPGGTWSGNGIIDAVNGTFDPLASGNGFHTICYVLSGVCGDSTSEEIIVNPPPAVTLSANDTLCVDDNAITMVGTGVGTGTYSGPGVSGNNFDPAVAGIGDHTVYYTVTNFYNCTAQDSVTIHVASCLGVDDKLNHVLNIYPNPSEGIFNIQVKGSSSYESVMEIFDASGRVVYTQNIPARFGKITLSTPNLSSGMYTLRLRNSRHVESHKIIVR